MTYKTLGKICLAISGSSIVYMLLITYEGTYFGWTVFFVFLAFAILFDALDEQAEEIETLRRGGQAYKQPQEGGGMRGNDLFSSMPNGPVNPRRVLLTEMQKEIIRERKENETNSSQNKNIKDLSVEKSEIIFIPTLHPGMEKQWGIPNTAKQLLKESSRPDPSQESADEFKKVKAVAPDISRHQRKLKL